MEFANPSFSSSELEVHNAMLSSTAFFQWCFSDPKLGPHKTQTGF